MARESFTVLWCDKCGDQGTKKEAIATETVSLGKLVREVDLCFDCRAELIEPLRDVMTRLGIAPAAERPPRGYRGQAEAVNGPHDLFGSAAGGEARKPPSTSPKPSACPLCPKVSVNRNALQAHVRTFHGSISLDQAEEKVGLPSTSSYPDKPLIMCEDAGGPGTDGCVFGCRSNQGFRMHRKTAHNIKAEDDRGAIDRATAAAEARATAAA